MNALDGYRSRAPRLKLVALVVVGLVVAVLIGFALLAPDPTVDVIVNADGQLCTFAEGQVWMSEGPVLPEAAGRTTIEGRWARTGEKTAVLTTSTGRVLELWTDQVAIDEQTDAFSCSFLSDG